MADVRAMLRASRDARRTITHPHASYTSTGKLLCNLCDIVIKHESGWQSHLHTTQHNMRQRRVHDAAATKAADGANRKRKASDTDSPPDQDRKKAKPADVTEPQPGSEAVGAVAAAEDTASRGPPSADVVSSARDSEPRARVDQRLDAAELDDFERELAELEASIPAQAGRIPEATISAAPVTAEDIAARVKEEQSAQRALRTAELEGEKEDAARLLEEELEEMESLEQRAKRLRKRREALRGASGTGREPVAGKGRSEPQGSLEAPHDQGDGMNAAQNEDDNHEDHDPEDDDEDEDGTDYWDFG